MTIIISIISLMVSLVAIGLLLANPHSKTNDAFLAAQRKLAKEFFSCCAFAPIWFVPIGVAVWICTVNELTIEKLPAWMIFVAVACLAHLATKLVSICWLLYCMAYSLRDKNVATFSELLSRLAKW